jgi:hypothetical protein
MHRFAIAMSTALFIFMTVADGEPIRRRCPGNKNPDSATWYSIAHPGLGEYYLRGWGPFWDNAPQKKFWLGFIPIYGWPGYLQVKSAIDAHDCRIDDTV